MDKVTIIKSSQPEKVCKVYTQNGDVLEKSVIANVFEGIGKTEVVETAADMVDVLSRVTNRQDLALCAGVWHNAKTNSKFRITTERNLASILGVDMQDVPGGIIEHEGELISARLKRGIDYSSWLLLDADNPPGMPDDWAEMSIQERLELWDRIIPNISKCERIELRGSSARVHRIGDAPQANATHAWIKVTHADKIATLKAHIRVHMVLKGLSFTFDKISKNGGTIVGKEDRSLFDLAVMDAGRLVFCAKPEVISDRYTVSDANVTIVNDGAGPLDISWVELPNSRSLYDLKLKTGIDMRMSYDGSNVHSVVTGELSPDTPIEVKGSVRPLSAWVQGMQPQDKLRCEAPFRVSQSEAAFIRIGDNGMPFVHDIGSGTTYKMRRDLTKVWSDFTFADKTLNNLPEQAEKKIAEPSGSFDDWVFLTRRNVFRNAFTGQECTPAAYNLAFGRDVPELVVNGKTVRMPATKYLINELNGRVADDVLYVPTLANGDPIFRYEGVDYINSYMINRLPVADPDWKDAIEWQICEDHLKIILPEDWHQLLCWMAHNVQFPGKKILWAPIIKGIQGDGKSTLARMLGAAMGHHNVRMIATEEIQSDFNGWAEGACVGVLEEIRIKGHNRHDAMNKLKPLVTNEKISVVRKGQDGRNIPNSTNYMALTNHEDALVLEEDDRRWGVFFTRFKTRQELLAATDAEYWESLNNAINKAPSIIRGWLMSVDLSNFNACDGPKMTDAKQLMIDHSRPDDEISVIEAIELGAIGLSKEALCTDALAEKLKDISGDKIKTRRMSMILKSIGMVPVAKPIIWNGKTRRVYVSDASILDDRSKIKSLLDLTVNEAISTPFSVGKSW